jgi:hypothetical protein
MELIALWDRSQDISTEQPRSVRWADGRRATLDTYIEHFLDTRVLREDDTERVELHMFPDIVADVVYDEFVNSWVVKDSGFGGWSLDIADRAAKDHELIAALSAFPVVYRATVRR